MAGLDLVVCATFSGDTPIPSTAVWIQRKLGMTCPAFDVNAACAGFSYGLATGGPGNTISGKGPISLTVRQASACGAMSRICCRCQKLNWPPAN